jgi:predicted ATPase/DNA-binding SARP family transcriptional activator
MEFGVLGPLEVRRNGQPVDLGGAQQRALLAVLLLHRGEVVSVDQLIDALWGERPPVTAVKTVQTYVSRLRRALGDGLLLTRPGGYVLDTGAAGVDVDRFEGLVAAAREALRADDPPHAEKSLRAALGLWRGDAIADFRFEPFAQAEISRLEEMRLVAIEDRIDAELAVGDHRALVGELEGLVRDHPLRERLHGQLMLALYRAGRQADALARYRELSQMLADELGLQPGESLRELERAILQHDPSLLTAPAASAPAPVTSHLPVPATPFLGRARELAEVTALLRDPTVRLLTLTGVGGSGKTRLALQAAHECAGDHRGGVWFVAFAAVTNAALIAPVVREAIGLVDQPGLTATQRLEGYLRDREILLVLDNLEQLTPEVGVLGELLARCPGVRMLVTSREPLHLAAEQQYEVPLLAPEDALELFTARAKTVAPSVIIERETVSAVCEQLDRLPLAIELAAARTKLLSPAQILARLEGHLPVLATGPNDAPQRQHTLSATIDWSYDLLTDEEQRLFTRLSVFAGGCTLDAAEAVCHAELDTLEGLVDRSLVRSGNGRYWMLQTLREYATDKLAGSGEKDDVRRRHARWFVELLASHGLDKSADVDTGRLRALLAQERENFRAALESAERAGEVETVARLAAPLTRLWREEGSLGEADRWISVARLRSTEYPRPLQALVLSAARELAWARGAPQEWADLNEQALAVFRELGDVGGIIRAMDMRAQATADLGEASATMDDAVQLAREHPDTGWLPRILGNRADIAIAEGNLDQARALCEEALSPATGAGPSTFVAVGVRMNLAYIANLERRHADAAELAQEALSTTLAGGNLQTAGAAAMYLAWSLAERRQPERAARLLGAAAELFRHTGAAMQWSETAAEHAARAALDRQLDERTLNALLDEGRTMTIEQAALIAGRLTSTPDALPRPAHRLRSV